MGAQEDHGEEDLKEKEGFGDWGGGPGKRSRATEGRRRKMRKNRGMGRRGRYWEKG